MIDISIIIPMYNASDFVEQCIQSAINQADIRKEIIVVDDGSTDNSAGIVESIFGNKVILFRKENCIYIYFPIPFNCVTSITI